MSVDDKFVFLSEKKPIFWFSILVSKLFLGYAIKLNLTEIELFLESWFSRGLFDAFENTYEISKSVFSG